MMRRFQGNSFLCFFGRKSHALKCWIKNFSWPRWGEGELCVKFCRIRLTVMEVFTFFCFDPSFCDGKFWKPFFISKKGFQTLFGVWKPQKKGLFNVPWNKVLRIILSNLRWLLWIFTCNIYVHVYIQSNYLGPTYASFILQVLYIRKQHLVLPFCKR